MKTRFSCLGSASLLLATASLHAHSFYGNLRGQPLAKLPIAMPSLTHLIHAGFEVQNNAVAAMAELQLPAKTRVGAVYSHFSPQGGFYGFGSWSPWQRLQVMGLINQQGQCSGYGRLAIIQGRVQGLQAGLALQLGSGFLHGQEAWKAASLQGIGESLLERLAVQFRLGWVKLSVQPLAPLSYLQLGIDGLQDGEGHVFEALRSLENLAQRDEHEQGPNLEKREVVPQEVIEKDENQAPPSRARTEKHKGAAVSVKSQKTPTFAASAASTQESLDEVTTTQSGNNSETSFLPLNEAGIGNQMAATLPEIEVFNESSFGCTKEKFSQLKPLVQLVLKCSVLHEKLLPGDNPGEAFWCNQNTNNPHIDSGNALKVWNLRNEDINESHRSINLIWDNLGNKLKQNYFTFATTKQKEKLFYFPSLEQNGKLKVKSKLEEYEKNNPQNTTVSELREVAKEASIPEEYFPEFFLACSYYGNGKNNKKYQVMTVEKDFSLNKLLKNGRLV